MYATLVFHTHTATQLCRRCHCGRNWILFDTVGLCLCIYISTKASAVSYFWSQLFGRVSEQVFEYSLNPLMSTVFIWVQLEFLTSGWDSGHYDDLWPWASECPDVKNYKWRLNPVWHRMLYSCTHIVTVGVKGSNRTLCRIVFLQKPSLTSMLQWQVSTDFTSFHWLSRKRLHQHSIGYTGDGFLQVARPNQQYQSTEGTQRLHN